MSAQKPEENADLTARLRSPQTVRAAFDEAMRLYAEPLYWQIRRLVQNHDDADDILQNTFMKAWMSLENFRGEAKLSTWLYKIAINESISFLEKERKRRHLSLDDQEAEMVSQIAADHQFDGDELARKLQEAVATLPEKQRIVFNMKYFDDMKYEDISDILGTTVGALKASYHLAVKKIEQFFDQAD
ncbi:MAG: RNA polymerase sigma factor [Muribaculaceae bacterium]